MILYNGLNNHVSGDFDEELEHIHNPMLTCTNRRYADNRRYLIDVIKGINMQDVTEIVKDAVKYPFLDWKKILILGIIILFSSISGIFALINTTNTALIYFLAIIGFLIGFLVNGYKFRIIKLSLDHTKELPKFNVWSDLFKSGIKVYLVIIIYLIPAILILLTFSSLSITSILGNIGSGSSGFISSMFSEATGIEVTIAKLYVTLITPLSAIAITNMVYNGGKFDAGFRFREILSHMSRIGWEKLIVWYITILILYYIFYYIGTIIFGAIEITFRFFGIGIFHMTLL